MNKIKTNFKCNGFTVKHRYSHVKILALRMAINNCASIALTITKNQPTSERNSSSAALCDSVG